VEEAAQNLQRRGNSWAGDRGSRTGTVLFLEERVERSDEGWTRHEGQVAARNKHACTDLTLTERTPFGLGRFLDGVGPLKRVSSLGMRGRSFGG
jgi:hypothetical protein